MFGSDPPRRAALKNVAAAGSAIAVSTIVYFALPLGPFGAAGTWSFVTAFALGLLAVASVIVRQIRRYRPGTTRHGSIASVVAALYLAVLFFAAVYFGLAVHDPASIASLHTKIDALYFSLTITATVGFGDVHAVGQLARAVAAVHMAFNIGFLGVAITVVRARSEPTR